MSRFTTSLTTRKKTFRDSPSILFFNCHKSGKIHSIFFSISQHIAYVILLLHIGCAFATSFIFLGHDKHSNARASNSSVRESSSSKSNRQSEKREEFWNNQSGSREIAKDSDRLEIHDRRKIVDGEIVSQDMDISPGDSTPTSETSYSHTPSRGDGNSTVAPVLLANALPRLASHPIAATATASFSPTTSSLSITSSAPPTAVTTSNVPGPPANLRVLTQAKISEQVDASSPQKPPVVTPPVQTILPPLQVDTTMAPAAAGEGPPTPTHSETLDGVDVRKSKFNMNFLFSVPYAIKITFCFF